MFCSHYLLLNEIKVIMVNNYIYSIFIEISIIGNDLFKRYANLL